MRIVIVLVCLLGSWSCSRPQDISQSVDVVYGAVPEFSLTDRSGQTVMRSDLLGKVWIADFIFTRCAGTCPAMSESMLMLQKSLPPAVQLVSFSVDPEHDTPEVLAEYAERYEADSQRWFFLTGEKQAIYDLTVGGFKLGLDENGTDLEPITHSSRFVLVDKQGQIRGYYGQTDAAEMKRLEEDARNLS